MSKQIAILILLSICFVGLPTLVFAASLEKAILLNEHGLTMDAKLELIDVIFEKGIKDEDKAQAYYLLGNIAFEEDRIKSALKSWERLVKKYPNSKEAELVRDRIAELSEIVVGSAKESLDNAVARSYLRHAEFWSEDKSDVFRIDSSWISNVETAIKWYDKVISEFPKSKAARIAYERKLKTLIGWREPGTDGDVYGLKADFNKYIPQLLQTFTEFERDHPDASTLQPFRFQIAQAYWRSAISSQSLAQIAQSSAETYKKGRTRSPSVYTLEDIQKYEKQVQDYQETAKKHFTEAMDWLNKVISNAGEHDSFYRDLAQRRLKHLKPR
ncbi:MAG: tetratricopeptide repeat protein [Candidatus Poribacteria bacterium]|nr:tetratricopeptide repeat protein [Candidatus Poribacteria bacterium]